MLLPSTGFNEEKERLMKKFHFVIKKLDNFSSKNIKDDCFYHTSVSSGGRTER